MKKTTITVEEAAEQLGTSDRHVRRLIEGGKITAERRGEKIWDVDAKSVADYAKQRKVGRPKGTLSTEPARSKRYGDGTTKAEEARAYNREYQQRRRAAAAGKK